MIIVNPKEDMHGNQKENIFLALDDQGSYITHAYVFPYENHHSSYARPRNIVMMIEAQNEIELSYPGIRKSLFDSCMNRAKAIKLSIWPNESVQVYGGLLEGNLEMLEFYEKQGFINDDATLIMERTCDINHPAFYSTDVRALNCDKPEVVKGYIERHNLLYPRAIDMVQFQSLRGNNHFSLLGLFAGERLVGECMVFEKEGFGYVEAFSICQEERGKGYSDKLMQHILKYFADRGLSTIRLEVWERNDRAIKLYTKYGFQVIGLTELYPGILIR